MLACLRDLVEVLSLETWHRGFSLDDGRLRVSASFGKLEGQESR